MVKQISEGGLKLETDRDLPKARMVVAFELPSFGEQRRSRRRNPRRVARLRIL